MNRNESSDRNPAIDRSVPPGTRYIHSRYGTRHITELLQTIAVAELIRPSRVLWLVSPWVSDIPILDNRANAFLSLEPNWSRTQVRLSHFLLRVAQAGTVVHIATRKDEHNREFAATMRSLSDTVDGRVRVHQSGELHQKGLLGDGFYLAGSMNFTYNGISVNEELVQFTSDSSVVAQQQVMFRARWGGE